MRNIPKVTSQPVNDRSGALGPREKMLFIGEEALSDDDLVTLVLGPVRKGPENGRLARRLLRDTGGLRGLALRKARELMSFDGMGPASAARLLAVFSLARRLWAQRSRPGSRMNSSREVYAHYYPLLRDEKKEIFFVLLLDGKNRLLREERVSEGSLTASIVHPREVYRTAIRESAASILAMHNHPSGDPSPSREDYEVTLRLKEAGDLVGIPLLDHVILGERRYVSFREHRLINW
jgi:DNA repair protein RadC